MDLMKNQQPPTDDFLCVTHNDQVVALYCETCEDLICPRCISQGPNSRSLHRDHVYLDMCEAYHIKKKQLQQVRTNFQDATQTKKNERMEINAMGQKLKLELLRKKTVISKQTRCLRDTINKQERLYTRHLEAILEPALIRNDARFRDADFDVVSREGILGSTESVFGICEEKAIKFLRGQKNVERDMVKISTESVPLGPDGVHELHILRRENLSLHHCKQAISRAFCPAERVPSSPRVLSSWCTVGPNSASIVFKSTNHRQIHSYIIVCQPHRKHQQTDVQTEHTAHTRTDQLIIKRNKVKFSEGDSPLWGKHSRDSQVFRVCSRSSRVVAVIRNLKPETMYSVQIYAVNSHGTSTSSQAYLTTLSDSKIKGQGHITFTDPSSQKFCQFLWRLFACVLRYFVFLVILLWVVYSVYLSHAQVLEEMRSMVQHICDLVWHSDNPYLLYIYEILCPRKIPEFLSFRGIVDRFSVDSGLEIREIGTLDEVKLLTFSVHNMLKWLVEFGENRTGLIY